MMRVALLAACLSTLAVCSTGSRLLLQDGLVEAAASASALDCTRVHRACNVCRNQRIPGTKRTDTVCSSCRPGWRLRRDGKYKTCGAQQQCFGVCARGQSTGRPAMHCRCSTRVPSALNLLNYEALTMDSAALLHWPQQAGTEPQSSVFSALLAGTVCWDCC